MPSNSPNIRWFEVLHHIMRTTRVQQLSSLKSYEFDVEDWANISQACNLTEYEAKSFWHLKLFPQLFGKPTTISELKINIIKKMREHQWTSWVQVKWDILAEEVGGYGWAFVYNVFYKMLLCYVPSSKRTILNTVLNLLEKQISFFESEPLLYLKTVLNYVGNFSGIRDRSLSYKIFISRIHGYMKEVKRILV